MDGCFVGRLHTYFFSFGFISFGIVLAAFVVISNALIKRNFLVQVKRINFIRYFTAMSVVLALRKTLWPLLSITMKEGRKDRGCIMSPTSVCAKRCEALKVKVVC